MLAFPCFRLGRKEEETETNECFVTPTGRREKRQKKKRSSSQEEDKENNEENTTHSICYKFSDGRMESVVPKLQR